MDDNLAMPNYLNESLVNNIDFIRTGDDNTIHSLNKDLEISVLSINCDNVDVKKEITDDAYIKVEIEEKKDEVESLIVINDLSEKSPVVAEVSEETSKRQQENAVECDVGYTRNDRGSGPKILCGLSIGDKSNKINTKITIKSKANSSQDLHCNSCKKTFSSSVDFDQHMKSHRKEKLHKCTNCNKTFRQLNHLNMHRQVHLEKRLFHCEICLETFKCKSSLNSHLNKHFGVKDYSCNICSAAFHSKYEFKIHVIKHTGELPYKCKECGIGFPIAARLRRHMTIHTGERPFQCEVCGLVFRERFTLQNHMGVHLPRGPYPCEICGEEFSRLNGLTLHRRVHNTDGTYSYVPQKHDLKKSPAVSAEFKLPAHCSLTDVSVRDEPELKINFLTSVETSSENKIPDHSIIETNSNVDHELPMDISNNNLSVDQESPMSISNTVTEAKVSPEKSLPEGDGTSVPHPSVVQQALSTGTLLESQADDGKGYLIVLPKSLVERNYTLYTVCPPPATSKNQDPEEQVVLKDNDELQSSLFVCDNSLESIAEVPFQPDQETISDTTNKPKRSRKQKEALSDDTNVTVGSELQPKRIERSPTRKKLKKKKKPLMGKLYHCHQCGKDYKTSSNLNIHMRTHTGERPYYCDFCGSGFKQLAHLQSHVRIHTGENPYQCHVCDRAFNQSSRLKYHIQNVHVKGRKKRTKMAKLCSVRNFYCKICDYTFIDSCFKTDHMKTHVDEIKNKCEEYDASARGKLNLKTNDYLPCDEWDICELCGLQYRGIADLNLHKKELHGVMEESLEINHIQSDSNSHMNEGNGFNREIVPDNYVQVYSSPEIDVEACPVGNSSTESSLALSKESAFNIKALEDGKYQCGVCNKIFNTRSNARVHLRLHTDVRPYKCNDCGRAFRQISHLKDHVKMHTGEKPFKCSVCPAAFAQSSGVKAHIKKYHRGKAFAINNQKEKDARQDSFVFENMPYTHNDTVIINIESGKSVSIEHTRLLNEENCNADVEERCDICGKCFLTRYMKYHMRTHKTLSYKCIVCRKLHKKYELLSCNRSKEGKQYVCDKCESDGKCTLDALSHIPDTNAVQAQQKDKRKYEQTMGNVTTIATKCAGDIGTAENFEKNKYVSLLEKAENICDICNKHFRRKSSLKFQREFSHRGDKCITDKELNTWEIDHGIQCWKV